MAESSITLGTAARFTRPVGRADGLLEWGSASSTASLGTLGAALAQGSSAVVLRHLKINNFGDLLLLELRTSGELSTAWEINPDAIEVTAGSARFVVPGPNSPGATVPDSSQPYVWYLSGLETASKAFMTAYHGLDAAGKAGVRAVFRDGPAVTVRKGSVGAAAGVPAASASGAEKPGTAVTGVPMADVSARQVAVVRRAGGPVRALAGRPLAQIPMVREIEPPRRGSGAAAAGPFTFRIAATVVQKAVFENVWPRRAHASPPRPAASGRIILPQSWEVAVRASSPDWAMVTALEIMHPDVATLLRVVDATEEMVIEGETWVPLRFDARLAGDDDSRAPQAEIAMDNVGREVTRWIDEANGGHGATVRIMQLPGLAGAAVEWEMTLDVTSIRIDSERIVARLGFDAGLGRPAVAMRHDPQTTPGIF